MESVSFLFAGKLLLITLGACYNRKHKIQMEVLSLNITQIKLENFTVFKNIEIHFSKGVNIFIGENGTGKTHILKLLYSACQAASPRISFSNKIVRTMLPDDFNISRLITRVQGSNSANVRISAQLDETAPIKSLSIDFNHKTKRWDAEVKGEDSWEKAFQNISSIFIPAKEILSNSYNLSAATDRNNVRFDDTYIDIINSAKVDISVGRNRTDRDNRLKAIEKIINGTVYFDNRRDEFYLKKGNSKQEFNLVAEGIRKMALLWQLVKNGTLEKGAILFWDEPEANINPAYLSTIVELLYELQQNGVQIFISTHDYMLAKYFEVRKKENTSLMFHSFKRENNVVTYSSAEKFGELKNNLIIESFNKLLDEIYDFGE